MAEEYSSTMNDTVIEGSSRSSSALSLCYSSSPFESRYENEREDPWQEPHPTRLSSSVPQRGQGRIREFEIRRLRPMT